MRLTGTDEDFYKTLPIGASCEAYGEFFPLLIWTKFSTTEVKTEFKNPVNFPSLRFGFEVYLWTFGRECSKPAPFFLPRPFSQ